MRSPGDTANHSGRRLLAFPRQMAPSFCSAGSTLEQEGVGVGLEMPSGGGDATGHSSAVTKFTVAPWGNPCLLLGGGTLPAVLQRRDAAFFPSPSPVAVVKMEDLVA